MTNKNAAFREVIEQVLADIYKNLEAQIVSVTDEDEVLDESQPDHRVVIRNVEAVEEEWILCPEQRGRLSILSDEPIED